jgi:sugar-phosphatase
VAEAKVALTHGADPTRPAVISSILSAASRAPAKREPLPREIERREMQDTDGIVTLAGARTLLLQLPEERWAIATSCTRPLAEVRLRAAGLPVPECIVTSTDVMMGKPHPEPFLMAATKVGFPATECVVVEDVPAGVRAGKAAGARVIGFRTTVEEAELRGAGANFVVNNCDDISLEHYSGGLTLRLNGAGVRN